MDEPKLRRLAVVEPPPAPPVDPALTPTERELHRVCETLRDKLEVAEAGRRKAEMDVLRWVEAWDELVADVGALLQRARAKPRGKQVVTVLELSNLLSEDRPARPRLPFRPATGDTGKDEAAPDCRAIPTSATAAQWCSGGEFHTLDLCLAPMENP